MWKFRHVPLKKKNRLTPPPPPVWVQILWWDRYIFGAWEFGKLACLYTTNQVPPLLCQPLCEHPSYLLYISKFCIGLTAWSWLLMYKFLGHRMYLFKILGSYVYTNTYKSHFTTLCMHNSCGEYWHKQWRLLFNWSVSKCVVHRGSNYWPTYGPKVVLGYKHTLEMSEVQEK